MKDSLKTKLETIKQGQHTCVFYDNVDELHTLVMQYIKIGFARNERCVYMADPLAVARFTIRLISAGIDVTKEVNRGALVLTSDRSHLENGQFIATRMIDFLDRAVKDALRAGFAGLRATGDVVWELGTDVDMKKLAAYEELLDKFFEGKKLTGLCQYNRNVIQEDYLQKTLSSHPTIVFDETVCHDHPFYRSASKKPSFDIMLSSIKSEWQVPRTPFGGTHN
jgi:hypothetical protein